MVTDPQARHYCQRYCNQTIAWLGSDSAELYQQNLRRRRGDLESSGWIDRRINYSFNSEGFRCAEFDDSPNIVTLGCSHTQGVGIDLEDVWAWRVAQQLGLRLSNLGVGGTSTDTAFRLGSYWIPRLRPRVVALLAPNKYRTELFVGEHELIDLLPGQTKRQDWLNQWYQNWVYNEINSDHNQQKNILALHKICDDLGIRFVWLDFGQIDLSTCMNTPRARDLAHCGPVSQCYIADLFLAQIA